MATIFTGGSVFDGHRHLPDHALLVDAGKVVAVGPEGALGLDSQDLGDAEVVDLAGGLVSPGFTDAHCHPIQGGLEMTRCDLSGGSTRDDYLALIRHYAAGHEGPWILGGGWAMAAFPGGTPTAAELDTVVPDRPAFLPNRDHHGGWVNTRALELAGITAESPDPPDGRIERFPDGSPTGTLHEGAMALVSRLLPPTPAADYARALVEGQRHLFSLGVTAWQDAIVGAYAGMDDSGPTYLDAVDNGDLVADVVGALWWDRDLGLAQIPDLVARRDALSRGRFRATSVKIMQDGVCENHTAAMLTPYLDGHGHETAGPVTPSSTARSCARSRSHSRPPASRCTSTRSATAGSARPSTRSPPPARPVTTSATPGCATTSPTSSSSTPTTSRASPRWASPPTPRRCGPATTSRWTT